VQVIDFIRVFPLYNCREISDNICMVNENIVEIGSVVKSLDFPHSTDCYYVGLVLFVNKADGTFTARTVKRVWEGKILESDSHFTAPLPGHHMFDDEWREPRIQVVA